ADDKPGVMGDVAQILGNGGISIEAVIQKEPKQTQAQAEIILLTHKVLESKMNAAIEKIEALESISTAVTRIRLETLDKE
ncbi:MAG: ACT domain-containing protein, partial [Gammaproteobacteria bacterium]|nr:ACT domain-containing protein [Gammaproteobacteria bacterium]